MSDTIAEETNGTDEGASATANGRDSVPNPTPDFGSGRDAFAAFLDTIPRSSRVVAMHDSDADGITAGVVWQRGMERLGFDDLIRMAPDRERNAWTNSNQTRIANAKPQHLFVMDLGCGPEKVLPNVPTCFVDHHRPEGVPPGDTLVTGYHWNPIPNTSLMIFDLLGGLTNVDDLDWIAAIGTISDLGERAPFPLLDVVKPKYKAKYLKEATTLINAARRASNYDPEAAARALLAHDSPRTLVESDSPDVTAMQAAREEVKAAMDEAKKAAPTFSGPVALVRIHTPCQIHPLIAQSWRTRLPKYMVFVANDGYLPGRVNFSARAQPGHNVLDFLKGIDLGEGEGSFGHGHDQASGGSLPVERWNRLLAALHFPESVFARDSK